MVNLFPHPSPDRETIALNLAAQVDLPAPDPDGDPTFVLAPVGSVELLCYSATDELILIENVTLSALEVDDLYTTHLALSPPADPDKIDQEG